MRCPHVGCLTAVGRDMINMLALTKISGGILGIFLGLIEKAATRYMWLLIIMYSALIIY